MNRKTRKKRMNKKNRTYGFPGIYKRKCLYKDRSLDGNAFEGGACLV